MENDPKNLQILDVIQSDATLTVDAISERVNLSRNACWRRIKMMEESGVIAGRVTILDAAKLGVGLQVYVMIKTDKHGQDWMEDFARVVRDIPQITGAFRTSGDLDYLLRVQVADVAAYDRFYKSLIRRIHISDVSASFVMEEVKSTTALPLTPV